MLRLRGTFDGEYINFDLVASLTRLQHLLAAHLDQHYPGECVTVTVCLHPELRGRTSRRHEEYVFDPVWNGRDWIVWEAPQDAPDQIDAASDTTKHPEHEQDCIAHSQLQLSARP